jgi:hypothetical protein
MNEDPCVTWWINTLRLAARDRLGRVAALVSGCSRFESTLNITIPEASSLPDLSDKIDLAYRQQYPIARPTDVHWARKLRNTSTHDATVPSHMDALNAVGALARADLAVRLSGRGSVSQVELEYLRLVNAGDDPVIDSAHNFDLQDSGDRLALQVASRSADDADRSAAILIVSSLLERSLDDLICSKLERGDERKALLDLTLKPKLAELFKKRWILADQEEEQKFVLRALTARNKCAHEDVAPSEEEAEQQVAAIIDVAREAASQVPERVDPSREPEPMRPDTVVLPTRSYVPPPSESGGLGKLILFLAGACALIIAIRTCSDDTKGTHASKSKTNSQSLPDTIEPLRNLRAFMRLNNERPEWLPLVQYDLTITAGAYTRKIKCRKSGREPCEVNLDMPSLARDASVEFIVDEYGCFYFFCADIHETYDASRGAFTDRISKQGINIALGLNSIETRSR